MVCVGGGDCYTEKKNNNNGHVLNYNIANEKNT